MFELFVMSLREYWSESSEDAGRDVQSSIDELQGVLSEHFGKEVVWDEPEVDAARKDDEISVDVIDEAQLGALQAVAAKLELDNDIDGLEFDPEDPFESDVFERLEDKLENGDPEVFPHILTLGESFECICIPVDLPFIAQINVNDDEEEEEEHEHHHCDCGDDDCCCCEEDDNSIDISSTLAIRKELDAIAAALKIDTTKTIDDAEAELSNEDDAFRSAKIAWYILSAKINDAIKAKQPMMFRYTDDEYDDLEEMDDED